MEKWGDGGQKSVDMDELKPPVDGKYAARSSEALAVSSDQASSEKSVVLVLLTPLPAGENYHANWKLLMEAKRNFPGAVVQPVQTESGDYTRGSYVDYVDQVITQALQKMQPKRTESEVRHVLLGTYCGRSLDNPITEEEQAACTSQLLSRGVELTVSNECNNQTLPKARGARGRRVGLPDLREPALASTIVVRLTPPSAACGCWSGIVKAFFEKTPTPTQVAPG